MYFTRNKKVTNPWKKYSPANKSTEEMLRDLHLAAKEGRDDVIKIIIDSGVDVKGVPEKEQNSQGLSALHLATRHNHPECVQILLENGADVKQTDLFGFQAIHDAALNGHDACMSKILEHQHIPTAVKVKGLEHVTALYYAVQYNHCACVDLLNGYSHLSDEVICDICSKRGPNDAVLKLLTSTETDFSEKNISTWLKQCAQSGFCQTFDWLKMVLGKALTPMHLNSALIHAVQHGCIEFVQHLLKNGADPKSCSEDRSTPLHYAARYSHLECIDILCACAIDKNAKDMENWAPIHVAVRHGNNEAIAKLIECGVNINTQGGPEEDTPLHAALKLPAEDVTVEELLKGKPNPTIKNGKGILVTEIPLTDLKILNDMLMEYMKN